MISNENWLGIRLETQRQRRMLVCGYYSFMMLLEVVIAWRIFVGHRAYFPGSLLALLSVCFGLLGGIRAGGPVKPYSDRYDHPSTRDQAPITLFIQRRSGGEAEERDERDLLVRDRAHYQAYTVLRVSSLVLALGFLLQIGHFNLPGLSSYLLLTGFPFFVLLMTLPQAIILWSEPNMEAEAEQANSAPSTSQIRPL